MNKQITVAVDLDGTLAEYSGWKGEDYIGDPLPDVQQVMSELADIGAQIIIFTTRGNEDRVAEWLNDSDIPFDHINENPDQPPGASHKVIADRYWDDRTPGWKGIRAAMDELGQYLQSQQPEQFARPLWRQAKSTAPPDTAVVIRYAGRLYAFDGDADVVQHALAGGKVTCPVVVAEVERYAEDSLKERIAKAAGETDTNPTDEQIEAENYKKGKFNMHGLQFSIENPKGSIRSGDGWQVTMKSHYGYILRTESDADGDHVDCFIGPDPESEVVFVVDQVTEGGKFDEHKCMIGWTNEKDAREAYLANYSAGWKCGPITAMTLEQFKVWLEKGDTGARVEGQVSKYRQAEPAEAAEPNTKAHWVSEIGPRGGKRWINANAPGNKPIYQDEMPGEDEAYRTIPVGKEDPAVTEALYPTQSSEKSPEEPGEPPEPVSEAEQIRLDAQAAAGEEPEAMGQPPAEAPAEQEPTGRTAQDVATAFGFTPPSDNPNQNERQANTYVLRAAGQMGFAPTATNRSEAARQASEYLSAQSTMLTGTIAMAEQHGYQGNPSRGMVLNAAGGAAHLVNTVRQQGFEPQGDTAQEVMASAVAHLVEGKGDDAQAVVSMLGSLASAVGMMSVMYLASRFGGRTGASVAGLIVGLARSMGHQQEGRSPKTVRSALEYLRGGQQFEPEDGQQFEPTIGGDATDPEKPQEKVSRPDDTAENLTAAWDGYRGALADKDGPKAKVYSEEIKHLGGDLDKPPGEERAKPIETQRKPREPKVKAPKRMEGKAAQRKAGEMLKRQQAEAEARLSPEDRTAREAKRGQETEQRNKEAKQEEQRNQAREAEVRRDRAKEAARAFDFAISQHLSDPDDQAMLKDVATNVWKQKRQENSQWNTAREEILGHILPNDPTARAAFTSAVQRAGDSDQIPRFDEAVQIAERDYGWFLEYDTGESAGKGDAEGALFKALKQGKRKDPPRHDPKILKEAMGWIEHHAGWPSDEGEEREPTEESRRKEAELRELEAVPFSLRRWLELVRYAKWTGPNTGPRGGVYWISSETGLKHYGERPPEEGETSQPQQQPAEENVELQAAREKIKDSHSLDDIAAGKYPIGAEGSGGEDAEEARAQGMFVVRLRGHDFFALSEEAAQPMIDYMKGGGRYGTTTMSRLMGYTPEQIADYANFLRLSGRDDLIDKDPTPQTASPEFRKWFGDSKVVDDDGEPLRVFHGTHDPGFDEFKLTGASDGFFFAPNPDDAIHRATTQKGVLPVYLSLQNPRMMDSHESAGVSGEVEPENEAIMDAKEMGHDGIILFADDPDLRTYVAFDASQIKSATGNRGTFDPDDPRITYRRTGARMKYQEPTVPPPHAKGYRARIRAGLYQWITRDGEGNRKTFLIWNISPGRGLGNLWSAAPVEEENGQKTVGKAVFVRKTLTGIEDGLRQMLAG